MQYMDVTSKAADQKNGMTLRELGAFVQECLRQDIDSEVKVRVQVGFRAQIQKVSVTGERLPE
jgi:hypothetical protein